MKTKATIYRYLVSNRQYVIVILRNVDTGRIINTQTSYIGEPSAERVASAMFKRFQLKTLLDYPWFGSFAMNTPGYFGTSKSAIVKYNMAADEAINTQLKAEGLL